MIWLCEPLSPLSLTALPASSHHRWIALTPLYAEGMWVEPWWVLEMHLLLNLGPAPLCAYLLKSQCPHL